MVDRERSPALRLGVRALFAWPGFAYLSAVEIVPALGMSRAAFAEMSFLTSLLVAAGGFLVLELAGDVAASAVLRRCSDRPQLLRRVLWAALSMSLVAGFAAAFVRSSRAPSTVDGYLSSLPEVARLDPKRHTRAAPDDDALSCGLGAGDRASGPPRLDRCCAWVTPDSERLAQVEPLKTCAVHVRAAGGHALQIGEGHEPRSWRLLRDEAAGLWIVHGGGRSGLALDDRGRILDPIHHHAIADRITSSTWAHAAARFALFIAGALVAARWLLARSLAALERARPGVLDERGRVVLDGESFAVVASGALPPAGPVLVLDGRTRSPGYRADQVLAGDVVADTRHTLRARTDALATIALAVTLAGTVRVVTDAALALLSPWLRGG